MISAVSWEKECDIDIGGFRQVMTDVRAAQE